MKIAETLQTVASVLGSDQGLLVMLVLSVLAIAAPFADRHLIRRKRLSYRVLYNSKLGVSPDLDDGDVFGEIPPGADAGMHELADKMSRMTSVVVRLRNAGIEDIRSEDLSKHPLTLEFGGRVIWNARISDPSVETHRLAHKRSLTFLPETKAAPARGGDVSPANLEEVRTTSRRKLWPRRRDDEEQSAEPKPETPQWTRIELHDFSLQRKEQLKIAVVLREPGDTGELTKGFDVQGQLDGGRIVDESDQAGVTWPRAAAMVGLLLVGVLLATLLANASKPAADPAVACGDGELTVVGSSAFTPAVENIAEAYAAACPGSAITTRPTGSNAGVRELMSDDVRPGSTVALSDGLARHESEQLEANPLAVIVYTLVVDESVGIDELTTQQVRGIYTGRYRDWDELRPGPSVPIRIVGRGGESGSRTTFEQRVLGRSEGPLTSDSCDGADRVAEADIVRCERGSERIVLDEVASTRGAIGYVDVPSANEARSEGRALSVVELDGGYPDPGNIPDGYPFWTIEYLYTKGEADRTSLQSGFLEYLRSGTARDELHSAGYVPCVRKDGRLHALCRW
ncbi:ABC-type phosphate transport system substrate-binding protein [Prauserella sediminis]|uniref:ABC-type phosphate transport system substrate-binding protein n=1 Tax=Prauserella sediminis TaxID=577680 RepID=A0A839XLD2_9PSEU|nr:substrate-binding domain-containing protein [Prauserella sediminis]MBB3663417.1 ABC-type phosphate transport system substrate-binding protein [Prauserella sediminis]